MNRKEQKRPQQSDAHAEGKSNPWCQPHRSTMVRVVPLDVPKRDRELRMHNIRHSHHCWTTCRCSIRRSQKQERHTSSQATTQTQPHNCAIAKSSTQPRSQHHIFIKTRKARSPGRKPHHRQMTNRSNAIHTTHRGANPSDRKTTTSKHDR